MYCFIACMDLYSTGCFIFCDHYKIIGSHLVVLYSKPYAGNSYLQACSCGIYKESISVCIKSIDAQLLLYILICILHIALLEPIIV